MSRNTGMGTRDDYWSGQTAEAYSPRAQAYHRLFMNSRHRPTPGGPGSAVGYAPQRRRRSVRARRPVRRRVLVGQTRRGVFRRGSRPVRRVSVRRRRTRV